MSSAGADTLTLTHAESCRVPFGRFGTEMRVSSSDLTAKGLPVGAVRSTDMKLPEILAAKLPLWAITKDDVGKTGTPPVLRKGYNAIFKLGRA